MDKSIMRNLSNFPQKIEDLLWLENELNEAIGEECRLGWNRSRKCVEHELLNDNYDVEYCVIEHWAQHVGAEFIMDESEKDMASKAYIYR